MLTGTRLRQKLNVPARRFQALGNLSRLSIVYTLGREPMDFGRLVRRLKIPPSLLSHHLKLLVAAGLVTKTKVGKLATYYLAEDAIKEIGTLLRKFLSLQSESLPAGRQGTDIL
jgi:DNA-binding transcriptional ArsR family regulator